MLGMPQRRSTPPRLSPLQPGRRRGRSRARLVTALAVAALALGTVALVLDLAGVA
jgi:hypothetical protein